MNQYVYDEIVCIKNMFMPHRRLIERKRVREEYVIFLNDSVVSQMYAAAMAKATKGISTQRAYFICSGECKIFHNYLKHDAINDAEVYDIYIYESADKFFEAFKPNIYKTVKVCTFLDATAEQYKDVHAQEEYLAFMDKVGSYIKNYHCKDFMYVHSAEVPELRELKGGINGISEREYEAYAEDTEEGSPERFVLQVEEVIRKYQKQGINCIATRAANIFGPGTKNKPIADLLESVKKDKMIVLDSSEVNQYIGLNYIRYVVAVVRYMLNKGKPANIYILQQYRTTAYKLKTEAYEKLAPYGVNLSCTTSDPKPDSFKTFCSKKSTSTIPSTYCVLNIGSAVLRTVIAKYDMEFFDVNEKFRYDGKLDEIKKLEIEMLEEIKRICKKHDIKYFLIGGSVLGAVRHKGFIPWDDDMDVGFLRDDYEKFQKIAPQELDPKFTYQSYRTEKDAHYIFDKIRLKDTFFTTKFSEYFDMSNGLFIDLLVYDRTAKSPLAQKIHVLLLRAWVKITNIRWFDKPRRNIAYKRSLIFLPIMRLFPWSFYHGVFNWMLKWFRHTNNPYLIDGVGLNLYKGPFPYEWIEETIEVPYENTTFPIPKEYDAYLRHWYGDSYMQLLTFSERNSGHTMRRIDLGPYLSEFGYKTDKMHHAHVEGELLDYYGEE